MARESDAPPVSATSRGPLTVAVDARLRNGESGGVQQFVIGLAAALSALDDGDEEYRYLGDPAEQAWLMPYLRDRGRLMAATRRPSGIRQMRRFIGDRVPGARAISERVRQRRGNRGDRADLASSDGTLEASGVEIVHFPFQTAFTTAIPSIYQPWDLQHVHLPGFFTDAQRRWRDRAYRRFSEQASLVVVASQWAARDVVDYLAVPPDKLAIIDVPPIIHAYPDPDSVTIERARAELRLPSHFAYYPAQTWPHKNHVRLLEALASLRDRHGIELPLVCSGVKNANYPEIARVVRRLRLDDTVVFVGFVDPIRVRALYRLARFLVFPSLFEGWGLPIVEAFASGLPVACSNVTSLPDLVGDAALMFDPLDVDAIAEAMSALWNDEGLRVTLAARGRRIVAGYDWRTTARTFRACYRRIGGRTLEAEDEALLARSRWAVPA